MKCLACGKPTRTAETREEYDGIVLRRRRECKTCGVRFSTFEINELLLSTLQKYLRPHVVGVRNRWVLHERNAEIVRRVQAGEKRYLLADEFNLSPNMITHITRKAGIPAYQRNGTP